MIGIYSITNLVNNKKYIGQSIDIEDRWKDHIRELNKGCHHNTPLQNSWNKHGIDSFSFSILCECATEDLNRIEIEYIEKYKTFVHREDGDVRGYNLTIGGDMGTRGRYGENATNTERIICLNTMKVYECAKFACEEYGIDASTLSKYLLGKKKYKSCGKSKDGEKLIWDYYDENKPSEYYMEQKEEKMKKLMTPKKSSVKPKPVICLETMEVFRTSILAFEKRGVHNISSCCKGKTMHSGRLEDGTKLSWMYYEDYIKLKVIESEAV